MRTISLVIITAAALWLIGLAFLMALCPRYCFHLFVKMSLKLEESSWRVQFTEQGLRVLAGLALIVHAPASKLPLTFDVFGWLLVATSVLIMMAPIRWHGAYGVWWMERLTPLAIRLLSPMPAILGAGLIYAAV